jgi:hypothetical protein
MQEEKINVVATSKNLVPATNLFLNNRSIVHVLFFCAPRGGFNLREAGGLGQAL